MATAAEPPILKLERVCKAFPRPSGAPLSVLEDIDLTLAKGEILGLLGRSGSGKSTLLRIAAGLIKPTSGEALYESKPLERPPEGIAMVFQTFALFPWLTVAQNVEAGLSSSGLPYSEVHRRATSAIELIGLSGFQSAYPRELSGGMRQRVGFARAFVTQPTLLLMDEPFSALDVLTAETLRTDFIDLWMGGQLATRAILLVTHNIEEAVLMCDRIIVLSTGPGRIAGEFKLDLPQPRDRQDPAFHAVVDEIYSVLTSRALESIRAAKSAHPAAETIDWASPTQMVGLLEALAAPAHEGAADLRVLARQLNIAEVVPIAAALHRLEFADLSNGRLKLTASGRAFALASAKDRSALFREHLLRFVPLAAHIMQVLDTRSGRQAPRSRFETELEDHLSPHEAQRTLSTVIGWCRYAGLIGYDDKHRQLKAEP